MCFLILNTKFLQMICLVDYSVDVIKCQVEGRGVNVCKASGSLFSLNFHTIMTTDCFVSRNDGVTRLVIGRRHDEAI